MAPTCTKDGTSNEAKNKQNQTIPNDNPKLCSKMSGTSFSNIPKLQKAIKKFKKSESLSNILQKDEGSIESTKYVSNTVIKIKKYTFFPSKKSRLMLFLYFKLYSKVIYQYKHLKYI